MDNSVELQFLALLFGLFMVVRFRQLGKYMEDQAEGTLLKSPNKKSNVLFAQSMVLIVGLIFFIVGLVKIIRLLS